MEDGVLFILFVLIIVVLIYVTSFKKESKEQNRKLNNNIIKVYKKLAQLEQKLENQTLESKPKIIDKTVQQKPSVKPLEQKVRPTIKKEPEIQKEPIKQEEIPLKKELTKLEEEIQKVIPEKPVKVDPIKPIKVNKPKRDFEKLIGENLLNKIGIAVLVIGVGFFVKYAIDKNWIGEFGRVAIGIGIGAIMIGIAHYLRKKYKAFSSVLIGGGIGVFYYTISIAYHDYHIFNQPVAFGIMTLITILAVALSVIYDKKEIAIIGLVGGFTSPFMVQGETENYVAFFTYIAILNSGMLALSYFKKWNIIQKLAYGFTILFFGTWLIQYTFGYHNLPKRFALLMGTIYFIQFLATALIYNIKRQLKFNAFEFINILSINGLYFLLGLTVFSQYQPYDYQGLFAFGLSAFNFLIYFGLRNISHSDENLKLVFLGKSITFTTLGILMQFDVHYAALFWALEAVVLLWLSLKSKDEILKYAFLIVTIITGIGLLTAWTNLTYGFGQDHLNQIFYSSIGVIATYVINIFILKQFKEDSFVKNLPTKMVKNGLGLWAYFAFYLSALIRLNLALKHAEIGYFDELILWIYHGVMLLSALTFLKIKKTALFREIFTVISTFFVGGYLITGNFSVIRFRDFLLHNDYSSSYFFIYLILLGLILYALYLIRTVIFQFSSNPNQRKWTYVGLGVAGLILVSMQLDHWSVFFMYDAKSLVKSDILKHTQAEGYTTLWSLYSFALMFYGMRKKITHLRVLSLVIFGAAIIKLFFVDIRNMSEAGKIIAFISLGVLLLVVSFLYQKLKQIIVGETIEEKSNSSDVDE